MLVITLHNRMQTLRVEHPTGPIEFGRRDGTGHRRVVVQDPFVSRDHLRLTELPHGRLHVECLSTRRPVVHGWGQELAAGAAVELPLPARLQIGQTTIEVAGGQETGTAEGEPSLVTIMPSSAPATDKRLTDLGDSPAPLTLTHWFETLLRVQQAAVGSNEFYAATARAVVDLIGLDRGLVLLRRGDHWQVVAENGVPRRSRDYSRSVLQSLLQQQATVVLTPEPCGEESSLLNIEAVVAAPIMDARGEIVGAVYGSRDSRPAVGSFRVTALEAQVVQLLAAVVSTGQSRVEKAVEAATARTRLEQFASSELAQELQRNPHLLDGAEREITALFCDLRGFSGVAERLGPARTYRLLGEAMDFLSECVFAQHGVIVDYFGDGLCAMWNAPIDQADHAARACRAALAMSDYLPHLDRRWQAATGDHFQVGIGINTGKALVGNAGSRRRMKYGPRGHTVNLASRVEGVAKQLRTPLLLTGTTQAALQEVFPLRRLCVARVAGITEPVALFELYTHEADPDWGRLRAAYETALRHYEARRWTEAWQIVEALGQDAYAAQDGPTENLRRRLEALLRDSPPEFDGVFEFAHK